MNSSRSYLATAWRFHYRTVPSDHALGIGLDRFQMIVVGSELDGNALVLVLGPCDELG